MSQEKKSYISSLLGRRNTNEDAYYIFENLGVGGLAIDPSYPPVDFYCICDGHGGPEISDYVCKLLRRKLMTNRVEYPISESKSRAIFADIDKSLKKHKYDVAEASGTTAIVVVRYSASRGNIQVFNVGDCRAVLSHNGFAVPLTKDHKPSWPDERIRIDRINQKLGLQEIDGPHRIGYRYGDWRVHNLSVSRAFGDYDSTPQVTCVPEVFKYRLGKSDEFIILACDGLWDVVDNTTAVNIARYYILNGHDPVYTCGVVNNNKNNDISEILAQYAYSNGSTDNITVMVIVL